jgi:hypothetical protein
LFPIDVAGREVTVERGRAIADLLKAIEVCGRGIWYAETGRDPGPTLLEKLLLDVCRDEAEGAFDETEDEND